MNSLIKLLVTVAVITIIVCIVAFFTLNSRLTEALDRLEAAEGRIDTSIGTLLLAKQGVDSVQSGLKVFSVYVRDIQGRVEIIDLKQRMEDEQFQHRKGSMNKRLKDLYRDIGLTGSDLPEIPIVSSVGGS